VLWGEYMDHILLEQQADRIEMALASQKVPARVFAVTVAPRVIRFGLTTALGMKVARITALDEEIALALGVSSVRITRRNGCIEVEVPRTRLGRVALTKLCEGLKDVPPCTAVLGLDEYGKPLLLRLSSPEVAHVLIAGTTGSGKTALMRSLLFSLAMYNPPRTLQVVLVDPKGHGLGVLANLPHRLGPLACGVEEATEVLGRLVAEMERRDRWQVREPMLVVAIDEVAELALTGGQRILAALTRLTQRGREAGVHVIASTQKPTAAILGSLAKANFPVRLVGSVGSPEEAKIATGIAGSGAEKLTGRGDFLLVNKGQCFRFQAAWIGAEALVQEIRRRWPNTRLALQAEANGTEDHCEGEQQQQS
jgi:S-DNA-T family DNA segregation ATPase FtsK/SpoIIIE